MIKNQKVYARHLWWKMKKTKKVLWQGKRKASGEHIPPDLFPEDQDLTAHSLINQENWV